MHATNFLIRLFTTTKWNLLYNLLGSLTRRQCRLRTVEILIHFSNILLYHRGCHQRAYSFSIWGQIVSHQQNYRAWIHPWLCMERKGIPLVYLNSIFIFTILCVFCIVVFGLIYAFLPRNKSGFYIGFQGLYFNHYRFGSYTYDPIG